ncbi:MAG: ATP-binding protein, partial [Bacteroidota bacterium]
YRQDQEVRMLYPPENIAKPGGRGIFLMKHLSDEVAFSEEGKIVELNFYVNQ